MPTSHPTRNGPQHFGPAYPLRPYVIDSPRARARLVVLALLADGRLDEQELAALERRGVFSALNIAREDFVQVLHEFCNDVAAHLLTGKGSYRLAPQTLEGLFEEVTDHEAQEKLLQLIGILISCDGRLSDRERELFWGALKSWRPDRWILYCGASGSAQGNCQ